MNRPFRIAVAAVIAALSVTVMVAPMASAEDTLCVQPPLAGDRPPSRLSATLSIKPAYNGHNVFISAVLRTSSVTEAHGYLGHGLSWTLWGDDPGGDDKIPSPIYPNGGRVTSIQGDKCEGRVYAFLTQFYNSTTGWLDEDNGPFDGDTGLVGLDEIYADVRFDNDNYRARTNTVYGFF
jgi:hypothetical protein